MATNSDIDDKYFGFLAHYYRAEVYRETNWRNRMDVTTNWVIVVTGVMLSFTFGESEAPHSIIILNYLIALFFLYSEARRFRYFVMLRERTRTIEEHLLAPILTGAPMDTSVEWRKQLAVNLTQPKVSMSKVESFAWRLRRTYMFLLPVIFTAWLAKISMVPTQVHSFTAMLDQAGIWIIPGGFVFSILTGSLLICMALAYIYVPRASTTEDLP